MPKEVGIGDLRAEAERRGVRLTDGRGFFPVAIEGSASLRLLFCALGVSQIQDGVGRLGSIVNDLIVKGEG